MLNAGLIEARCRSDGSESKAPVAGSKTRNARKRRMSHGLLQAGGVPIVIRQFVGL